MQSKSPSILKFLQDHNQDEFVKEIGTWTNPEVYDAASQYFHSETFFHVLYDHIKTQVADCLQALLKDAIIFGASFRNVNLLLTHVKASFETLDSNDISEIKISFVKTAIEKGNLEVVQLLLNAFYESKIAYEEYNAYFLSVAVQNTQLNLIQFFLECPSFPESILQDAVDTLHMPTIEMVLKSPHARPNDIISAAMENEDLLQVLIDHPRSHKQTLLIECIISGQDISFVEELLKMDKLDYLKDFQQALRQASYQNRSKVVELLLKLPGSNPTVDNSQCLRVAAENGHTETVRVLLLDGRSCLTVFQNEPLNSACHFGHLETVKLLLEYVDPNQGSESMFPIQVATYYGHTPIVELLLKDIRLDPQDCIVIAAERGHTDMVAMFVQHPNQKKDYFGSCLEHACRRGSLTTIDILLKHGTSISERALKLAVRNVHLLVVESLVNSGQDIPNFMNVFDEAVRVSSAEIIQTLIQNKAFDLSCIDSETIKTLVHRHLKGCIEAIFLNVVNVNYGILVQFLKHSIDIEQIDILEFLFDFQKNAPENETDQRWNPLTQAISNRRNACVDFLQNRVEPDGDRYEFLHSMIVMNHIPKVESLIKDPSLDPSFMRETCLPIAICLNLLEVVQLFFGPRFRGLSINHRHLVLACKWGHTRIVEFLLTVGHDPSIEDNECIFLASVHGHTMVVNVLLRDQRVDPAARESIAIVQAAEMGHLNVVESLLDDRRVDASTMKCALYKVAKGNAWNHLLGLLPKPEEDDLDNVPI